MTILTITATGQVTLTKDMLRHLGIQPGDRISIDKLPDGRLDLKASSRTDELSEAFDLSKRDGAPSLTIDEINAIAADGWARKA